MKVAFFSCVVAASKRSVAYAARCEVLMRLLFYELVGGRLDCCLLFGLACLWGKDSEFDNVPCHVGTERVG